MAKSTLPKSGVSNWRPATPSGKYEKLLQPGGGDRADVLTPENEQKQFEGNQKMPGEPFGRKGKCF